MWDQFTNDTCLPDGEFPCSADGYPAYVINVTTTEHVKLGIDFGELLYLWYDRLLTTYSSKA